MASIAPQTDRDALALRVVDVAGLRAADPDQRRAVAGTLRDACLTHGFFYAVNHGIPDSLIAEMFVQARRFFALPRDRKHALHVANSPFLTRGYEPLLEQTLEVGTPADLKEGFLMGPEGTRESIRPDGSRFTQGPNQWPSDLGGFRTTMNAYYDAILELARTVLRGMALSLDLAEDYFTDFNRDPVAVLRLLRYPPHPANAAPNQKGAGAHTDYGAVSFLLQDDAGGLQVWDQANGAWIDATPVAGSLVVNLGDMMARWTNDRYRSTLHRVINRSGRERYSIPFFYDGAPFHQVSCLPTCLKPGEHAKYPPTTVEQHLVDMYRQVYGEKWLRGNPAAQ